MLIVTDRTFLRFLKEIAISMSILLLPLLFPTGGHGQFQDLSNPLGCDEAVARQDVVVSVALERLRENSFLIVVIRPGAGETSKKLASERLFNINQYFRLRGSRITPDKLVIATGAQTQSLGQVEFYINGQLADALPYPRNGFICHACCGPDTDFYPDKGRQQKSLRRKS
ncbi:MAG: hypothetical protein H0V90_12380 [Blastocatellia bacterium]|nr:hypothetical protein [Blastocatellia bacterium]MDQ3219874.1 hypothetical protein [Acidobacteriota bacterium]